MKIPAIRGKIGSTTYYLANFTFQQIAQYVKKVDSEFHTSNSIKNDLQRALTDNYLRIKEYILNRQDRFFDSLVLAIYNGNPLWKGIRFEIEGESYSDLGLLELSGEETIFPVDGQHRVEGIKAAVAENPRLVSNETISVMLIGHEESANGRKRTRRIFSTLNRYVKPVGKGDLIALDEDDIVAIATRDIVEDHHLFWNNRVRKTNSPSLQSTDNVSITTLKTLYDANLSLLEPFLIENNIQFSSILKYLKDRPDEATIESFILYLNTFWDSMTTTFYELSEYKESTSENPAEMYRNIIDGGNLFFRPIGLLSFIKSIAFIKKKEQNRDYLDILNVYTNMNRSISTSPWLQILWDENSHKMITSHKDIIFSMFVYMYNRNYLRETDRDNLRNEYMTIFGLNRTESQELLDTLIINR